MHERMNIFIIQCTSIPYIHELSINQLPSCLGATVIDKILIKANFNFAPDDSRRTFNADSDRKQKWGILVYVVGRSAASDCSIKNSKMLNEKRRKDSRNNGREQGNWPEAHTMRHNASRFIFSLHFYFSRNSGAKCVPPNAAERKYFLPWIVVIT